MPGKLKARDLVHWTLKRQIESYRSQSFETFGIYVTIRPHEGAEKMISRYGTFLGYDHYVFEHDNDEPKVMQVILLNGAPFIWFQKDWRDITDWLQYLKPTKPWNVPDQQARWWAANGKQFKLFDLPLEIRQDIFAKAIGYTIDIKSVRRCFFATQDTTFDIPYMGMLLANTKLYKEASYPLFNLTTYYADSIRASDMIWFNKGRFSKIKHIELAFSHCEFFRFFGFQVSTSFTIPRKPGAEKLKSMKLRSLTINIAEASHTTAVNWLDGACQKTVVDWIMDSAAPFILRHNVKWTGDVKPANLAKWDTLIRAERQKMKEWQAFSNGSVEGYYEMVDDEDDGGVLLDEALMDARKPRVVKREFPPRCRCPTPCLPKKEDC